MDGVEQERGWENLGFPVAELFKPRGLKAQSHLGGTSSETPAGLSIKTHPQMCFYDGYYKIKSHIFFGWN